MPLNAISGVTRGAPYSDQALDSIFSSVPFPLQGKMNWYEFFNDFMNLGTLVIVAGTASTTQDWTWTNANGATLVNANEPGGAATLTLGGTVAWLASAIKIGNSFTFVAGKRAAGRIRFKSTAVADGAIVIGLGNSAALPAALTDGLFISKADGSAALTLNFRKAVANTTSASLGNITSGEYVTLDYYYDGGDRLYYALNGTVLGYLDFTAAYMPDTAVAPFFYLANGAAGTGLTLTIDTLWFAQER